MLDGIGWIATVIFSASYFFRGPAALYSLFSRRSGQVLSSLSGGPDESSIQKTDSAA